MFSKEAFKNALKAAQDQLTELELRALREQYAAPGRTVTVRELAVRLGFDSYQPVNGVYGRLARKLGQHLGEPPSVDRLGKPWLFRYLSQWHDSPRGFLWIMYEELAEALEELGIVEEAESLISEEIDASLYSEGAIRRIAVNAYERNPQARRACIGHYGASCFICSFDFGKAYGEPGAGFIHVHHLRQISEMGGQYQVDPIADLRPICPNCHAMVHRRTPPYSVEEVRAMLRRKTDEIPDSPPQLVIGSATVS